MPRRINEYLKSTGQDIPKSKGQTALCILESLALTYRYYITSLEKLLGCTFDAVHLIGGGVQDENLCKFTASATGKTVTAGPIEATALGNIAVQLIAKGAISDMNEARQMLGELKYYQPENADAWNEKYENYLKLCRS